MRRFLLLILVLTALLNVDARRRRKGKKGRKEKSGADMCIPSKMKKIEMKYAQCREKGFASSLGCSHEEPVKKLRAKTVKKCQKIESVAEACGFSCAKDGGWSPFGEWVDCSAECGGGSQTRMRTCDNPPPSFGGNYCQGSDTETKLCNMQPCPVDGNWSEFEDWSDCSTECGGGSQYRLRTCDNPSPAYGGVFCEGEDIETQDCNTHYCPVDGNWSDFGPWSECSEPVCGGGEQYRARNCDNPFPKYGGKPCEGEESETVQCNTDPCPVDGQWSGFGDWGECSVPCGGGIMPRRRTCDNPPPAYGGANCEGDDAEIQDCNIDPCPVDGAWSPFGEWSDCTVKCGGGSQTRTRACDRPAPAYGGADCLGADSESMDCNDHKCPVRYEFTHLTSDKGKWDGGAYSGYMYTVIGTVGETAEHDCEADRSLGGSSTCTVEDLTEIGDVKGLRIRNSGDNTWRFVKIDVEVDGVSAGSFEGYTVSIDDYATVTVPIFNDRVTIDCGRKSLGCWADKPSRAIGGGIRFHSNKVVEDCEKYAHERGFAVFAVQYGKECFTAADAEDTYQKHGESEACEDGKGGSWALDVYSADTCRPTYVCGRQSLGCWRDSSNRAITGGVRFNSQIDPVKSCEKYASENGFTVFAVQAGTQCFTSAEAEHTYEMYGPSENCKDGTGGSWAQSVYKTGSCPETPECSRKQLGCWKDDPLRAIDGGIRLSSDNPVDDCEKYAFENGFAVFAVQNAKDCFTSKNAPLTYQMYGPSELCEDGKGGPWALNVYKTETCKKI